MGLALDLGLTDLPPLALPDLPTADGADPAPAIKIHFAPNAELYETGNEPFQILRNLAELGPCTVTCRADTIPAFPDLIPEASYMAWDIEIQASLEEAEIASIFEFVEGLCTLTLPTRT